MRYTIFGESHGPAIGVVLEDVPPGLALDLDEIAFQLARRAPGKNALSTARREADEPEILSGYFQGHTTGTPLAAVIRNTDTRSRDYAATRALARPGHADYPAHIRYRGFEDYRGGGHFSGRLTAPLVFAGAVARQALAGRGIVAGAHIRSVGQVAEPSFAEWDEPLSPALLRAVAEKDFPTLSDERGAAMQAEILAARAACDSVGGVIECAVLGLAPGLGSPDLGRNVEGILSQHLFAIPGVKAVGFGEGFGFAALRGSEANDALHMQDGTVTSRTNHSGGVNGGITNGLPLLFSAAMRPTASIAQEQDTVNLDTWTDAKLTITGRHDPCIVHRAVPVVEAAAALAVCELLGI